MEGLNYTKFKLGFEIFKKEQEKNPERNENFISHIDNHIPQSKIFMINDKQKDFFIKGKVKVRKNMDIKLPFPTMFLDVGFTKAELEEYGIKIKAEELIGIMITKGYLYTANTHKEIKDKDVPEKSVGENIRFSICLRYKDNLNREALQFETFFRNVVYTKDEYEDNEIIYDNNFIDIKAQKFWYKFFLNLIRFVNYPEIRLKEHKRTEKNIERRIKRGKPAIPEFITVELTGVLERYIDEVYEKPKTSWHYNYRFDVKGHPRRLTSPRYKEPKEIWIEHYEKGVGKKVQSIYKIKRKIEK
jgi:hypothetical protein